LRVILASIAGRYDRRGVKRQDNGGDGDEDHVFLRFGKRSYF